MYVATSKNVAQAPNHQIKSTKVTDITLQPVNI